MSPPHIERMCMTTEVNWGNVSKAPPLAEILLMEEVSELTRLPLPTLRFYRHAGKGPRSFKLGNRVAYKRSDVLDWIEQQYNAERSA
jgi:predicted DNA-binding transcriptional regulator AlpA